MRSSCKKAFLFFLVLAIAAASRAQLVITPENNALALAQKLVGDGVVISNVQFTGNPLMGAHFNNLSGTKIGIDSGIVLTNGRAKTLGTGTGNNGVDGNGITPATGKIASNMWGLPGDGDLATAIGVPKTDLEDACVLEFDFVPLGDSIKFNYVFSSEEYTPAYVCDFNDAFAFFISGPGFPGLTNIALLPGTLTPVSIFNVNDVPGGACPNNQLYYWDNETNTNFTHDGHTRLLTALAKVQPCQVYHLKLVISDVGDDQLDSGVFLEAKSLTSNSIKITNLAQLDPSGNSYLVEGCVPGSIKIKRPKKDNFPLVIAMSYGGTVQNGIDIQTLPASVTIPANQDEVQINLLPLIDNVPEGIELLKIYALAGCASGLPTDSAVLQLRDYDILGITPDTLNICKKGSVTLTASAGYTTYQWDADPTLSSTITATTTATPTNNETTYYCTGTIGTCNARDSSFIKWKEIKLISKTDVNCKNGNTGEIIVDGEGWLSPVAYSINNGTPQSSGVFNNLPVGSYTVKIIDLSSTCVDSLVINILQAFPDVSMSTGIVPATCSGNPDGQITVTPAGGNGSYNFSADGINFQPAPLLYVHTGNFTIHVKDGNGCSINQPVFVPLNNHVTADAGADPTICEGKNTTLAATSNATSFIWTPATGLDNAGLLNPLAAPVSTVKYYLEATTGICKRTDSVTVWVNPAPIANAGKDSSICFGADITLNGSGGVDFLWSPASFLSDVRAANPTVKKLPGSFTYSLHVVDAKGCASLKKDQITITVTRPALVRTISDTSIAINQPLHLFATDVNGAGFVRYTWSPPTGLNNSLSANPVAVLNNDIRYIVTAYTSIGCESSDTVNVKVYKGPDIYVPNAFTPNNDGLNDVLHAMPIGAKQLIVFRLYDRWGNLVFSTSDARRGWDGKRNGNPQAMASYTWMAEAIDYNGKLIQRKGMVTLIR